MSGGYFDYDNYRMYDIATQLEGFILHCKKKNKHPDEDDWFMDLKEETIVVMEDTLKQLKTISEMVHHIDYLICGDIDEDALISKAHQLLNI